MSASDQALLTQLGGAWFASPALPMSEIRKATGTSPVAGEQPTEPLASWLAPRLTADNNAYCDGALIYEIRPGSENVVVTEFLPEQFFIIT